MNAEENSNNASIYSKEDLLSKETYETIFDIADEKQRAWILAQLTSSAKELGLSSEVNSIIKAFKNAEKNLSAEHSQQNKNKHIRALIKTDGKGNPIVSIENFLTILRNDETFKNTRLNLLSYAPEKIVNGKIERWLDVDDSKAREYIEKIYHVHNEKKFKDAVRIFFSERSYHPIKNIIEGEKWDGVERIPTLLIKWLKCNDDDYSREVSRLIFAGGINRLYNPGCKFDDVPVLIGTKQGEGKSTFVRWLALKDEFFSEVCEIEGQRGIEALEGAWICEIAELLALTKTKEIEAVKAYITKLTDKYRRPFDVHTTDVKRQCIFIGTTNKEQFLTDKTGNRRFYPIKVHQSGYELFDHRIEVQHDILQSWAEAKTKYDKGLMLPYADRKLLPIIREHQQEAVEEDYREGLIRAYLEDKEITCILDIWDNALNEVYRKPTRRESDEISLILQSMELWERSGTTRHFKKYGVVGCWKRKKTDDGFLKSDAVTPFD